MEAERRFPGRIEAGVMPARSLQQGEGADHVGAHEIARTVDRAVDVTFGRQMHDHVRVVRLKRVAHGGGIGDIGADQNVTLVMPGFLQRLFRGGVGHLVDIDHDVTGLPDQMADHRGADETAAPGQQNFHFRCISLVPVGGPGGPAGVGLALWAGKSQQNPTDEARECGPDGQTPHSGAYCCGMSEQRTPIA